jgi:hypothetical protein
MSKFSRLATKDDFEGCNIQLDHFNFMSDAVKELIEQNKFHQAVSLLGSTGKGSMWAKPYCEEYLTYLKAKRDFDNGHTVFIKY